VEREKTCSWLADESSLRHVIFGRCSGRGLDGRSGDSLACSVPKDEGRDFNQTRYDAMQHHSTAGHDVNVRCTAYLHLRDCKQRECELLTSILGWVFGPCLARSTPKKAGSANANQNWHSRLLSSALSCWLKVPLNSIEFSLLKLLDQVPWCILLVCRVSTSIEPITWHYLCVKFYLTELIKCIIKIVLASQPQLNI